MDTNRVIVILSLCSIFLQHPKADETLVVEELAKMNTRSIHVGDSLVFKHNSLYGLHIFCSKRAFDVCNFLQTTLLDGKNKYSYTFKPSRPGHYYFSYGNGTDAYLCLRGEKLAVRVLQHKSSDNMMSPSPAAAPFPHSGGTFRSSPALPWRKVAPSAAPMPSRSAGAITFITSNPAVPLPTGETDASLIRPLPMSGCTSSHDFEAAVVLTSSLIFFFF